MNNAIVNHAWDNVLNSQPMESLKKSGLYRAKVIETNDPLNINRVRVIIPDFHDYDLDPSLCPWASATPMIGGRGAFYFIAPTIGDWVWIRFEKDDPHVPVYIGFANPTRRGHYAIPQIHTPTSPILDIDGKIVKRDKAYDNKYLPKDGRPMKTGYVDTYGNMDISSAVGYFPIEHKVKPAPTDLGSIEANALTKSSPPVVNDPDLKYMLRMTKYGHIFLMSDQGYYWQKPEDTGGGNKSAQLGEFIGDQDKDYNYEAKRWLSIQRLLSEDDPKSKDRRRMLQMTRYGHVFDMRDVGWGQLGPIESKSRSGEYGPPRFISNEQKRDQRFIRLRTKGGMYFIMGDRGFHPDKDKYVKKLGYDDLKEQDQDLEKHWGGKKDARFIGFMTRYGWKFVLDDRGSDNKNADKMESPRGLGMLLKGRRSPGTFGNNKPGQPSGYFFQIMEKDEMNSLMMGSPMGHAFEMNDKYQYMMLASTMGRKWSAKWEGFKRHEYVSRPLMEKDPEKSSHHLKIDHQNEYIRFKTRGGRGSSPIQGSPVGVSKRDVQQGFEARDGSNGDGPWTELVDSEHRGIWLSKKGNLLILRGKKRKKIYTWFDDKAKEIVIYNGEPGSKIRIYSRGSIDLIAGQDVNIEANRHINMKAKQFKVNTGGAKLFMANNIQTDAKINAYQFNGLLPGAMPGPGAQVPRPGGVNVEPLKKPVIPSKIEPSDRGQTYNGPFKGIDKDQLDPEIKVN